MVTFRIIRLLFITALLTLPCFAGDVAVLKNGFTITHERREVIGDITRLYVNPDGSMNYDKEAQNAKTLAKCNPK